MGTTDRVDARRAVPPAVRPVVPPVAWDVPVDLVPSAAIPAASRGEARVVERLVDVGLDLPGIAGVVVTTSEIDGRRLLSGIRPISGPIPVRGSPCVAGGEVYVLRELLADLRVDGAVPVLVEGTTFALAVLTALTGIGAGQRCSYAELAARAGRPAAVRAAASVMATNRVPLVLPCHRVVPSGGGTGRYGWGDAVKRVLLAVETAAGCRPGAAPPTLPVPHASRQGRPRVPGGIA